MPKIDVERAEEAQQKQRLGLLVPKNEQKALNKIAKTKAKNAQNRTIVDNLVNARQNQMVNSGAQFMNQPGQFMSNMGDNMMTNLGNMGDNLMSNIGTMGNNMMSNIGNNMSNFGNNMMGNVNQMMGGMVNTAGFATPAPDVLPAQSDVVRRPQRAVTPQRMRHGVKNAQSKEDLLIN